MNVKELNGDNWEVWEEDRSVVWQISMEDLCKMYFWDHLSPDIRRNLLVYFDEVTASQLGLHAIVARNHLRNFLLQGV